MQAAALRYRVMAYITGVLIIMVCFVGVPLQFVAGNPLIYNKVATVHGFLYIVYVVSRTCLAQKLGDPQADGHDAAGRHDPGHDVRR